MFTDKGELLRAGDMVLQDVANVGKSTAYFSLSHLISHPSKKTDVVSVTSRVLDKKTFSSTLSLQKRMEPSSAAFMAEMMDCASGAANFDWSSNPAASDGEIIACEMIRKMSGLKKAYSFSDGGLELFLPHINEALLLCYHSTTYNRGIEAAPQLVVYGVNDSLKRKPFQFRNCSHVRATPYTDEFRTSPDFSKLRETILEDINGGLIPHFLICTVTELNTVLRVVEISQMLASEFDMKLFIDLSPLGIQVLSEDCCVSFDADFVYLDVSEASHLSSGVLFLQDKNTYEKNIVNPPQEYLKQPDALPGSSPIANTTASIQQAKKKFDAYDFSIGFSNYVSWQKFLFYAVAKGKKGIREAIDKQKSNLNMISKVATQAAIVEGIKVQQNYVIAKLKKDPRLIASEFIGSSRPVPFEIMNDSSINLVRFYAPLGQLQMTEVESLFDLLNNFVYA
jgi:hypothetical protein